MQIKPRIDVYSLTAIILAVGSVVLILAVYFAIWLVDNWMGQSVWVYVIYIAASISVIAEIIYQSGRHRES